MKLLLDEMYSVSVAEQLRTRGHDVVSVNDAAYRWLAGAPDEEVYGVAVAEERALVTEDVSGYRRIEAAVLATGAPRAALVFTTNRQFPRHGRANIGRLVTALDAFLTTVPNLTIAHYLEPVDPR